MASGVEGLAAFEVGLRLEGEQRIPAQVALIRDRLTLGVHRRVVLANPVDTGFSRAAWNASVGTPDERTPGIGAASYPPPETPVSLGPVGKLDAAGRRRGAGGRFISGDGAFEPGYVTNAAPYVVFLNEGSSQQAPAHFVQRAIEEEIADFGG